MSGVQAPPSPHPNPLRTPHRRQRKLIIRVNANVACPEYSIAAGSIVDAPADIAKKLLASRQRTNLGGPNGPPVAELVVDPKEREKAKRLAIIEPDAELDEDGWRTTKGGDE